MITSKKVRDSYVRLPLYLWAAFFIGALSGLNTPNPWLTFFCVMVVPCFIRLTWRKGEPPVLFFAVTFQWLSVTAKIFHANSLRIDINTMFGADDISLAVQLSLAALLVLCLGMRLGLRGLSFPPLARLHEEMANFSTKRLFAVYLVSFFLPILLRDLPVQMPNLRQLFNALFELKWLFFFLLSYVVLQKKKHHLFLIVALLLETLLGFSGYFSDFKKPFFILLIVYLTLGYRFRFSTVLKTTVLFAVTFLLGIGWTVIKGEYRNYLNQGTGEQVVLVPWKDRLQKLWLLYTDLDIPKFNEGLEDLAKRLAYVDFFARTLQRVPRIIPHEDGGILKSVLQHIFMPRLFFPDKAEIIDTGVTEKYTGLNFAESGTSVSLGYVAEAYVDFGPMGMFVLIFFIGVLWGSMYKFFVHHAKTKLFGYVTAVAVLMGAAFFEANLIKIIGGTVTSFLVMVIILKYFIPILKGWLVSHPQTFVP